MANIEVSGLHIYPLKSAQGLSLNTMNVDARGPVMDREWMLIDEAHNFVSQRTHPNLCRISTEIKGEHLIFSAPGLNAIETTIEHPPKDDLSKRKEVKIFGKPAYANLISQRHDEWFSEALSTPVHLVRSPIESPRKAPKKYDPLETPLKFADGFSLLIATEESLADLNDRLDSPILMERFRPNIIVKGGDAFEEDHWLKIRIGSLQFEGLKACARCVIITIDPLTGLKDKNIMKTLGSYRTENGKVIFGKNLSHRSQGQLNVGDRLQIES